MDIAKDKLNSWAFPQASPQEPMSLIGWEYMDLVRPSVVTIIKQHVVNQAWVQFTRELNAVVMFGRGFGEILRPVNRPGHPLLVCKGWTTVPREKDYLATDVHTILELLERTSEGTYRLSPRLHWKRSQKLFESCQPQCTCTNRCDRVQQLLPVPNEPGQKDLKRALRLGMNGAVIFGSKLQSQFKSISRKKSESVNNLALSAITCLLTQYTDVSAGRGYIKLRGASRSQHSNCFRYKRWSSRGAEYSGSLFLIFIHDNSLLRTT
jgi:hypothetical protein